MATVPVYIDDFSGLVAFSGPWITANATNGVYTANAFDNTYHEITGGTGSFAFNFTGSSVALYGTAASNQQYTVTIDGQKNTVTSGAVTSGTSTTLASQTFSQGSHTVVLDVTASGSQTFSFDYALVTVQAGGAGATLTNTSIEDTDSRLQYSGSWTQNTDATFSGGTTHYTSTNGGSVSLRFNGSSVYVFGDRADFNHGPYTISIDGQQYGSTLTGAGIRDYKNTLMGLVTGLNSSEHTVTVTNLWADAAGPAQYFDLDRFVVTQPSVYAASSSTNPSSASASPSSSGAAAAMSSSITPRSTGAADSLRPSLGLLALLVLFVQFCRARI